MKRFTLALMALITAAISLNAQTWEWGTATWNIEDGSHYASIDELNAEGITLTFPNPAGYTLTFLNLVAISYDLYVDQATQPIHAQSSAQMSTAVTLSYRFVEGHTYTLVTTAILLAQANLATYTTDTLSLCPDTYTLSFSIDGPQLVKTLEAEATQALTIINQEEEKTISTIDVDDICTSLGISTIAEADIYALNTNGSYCEKEWYGPDYFDGWRDADGELTTWYGGYNQYDRHNAYPAVYSIQLNETADTLTYYFYDYWREYDPDEEETTGGSTIASVKRHAPATSYHSLIVDWDNGDGTTTQYKRYYRCDEGTDYTASFLFKANQKAVRLNATLHFVSQADYSAYIAAGINPPTPHTSQRPAAIYNLSGAQLPRLQKGVNILRNTDGSTRKVLVN